MYFEDTLLVRARPHDCFLKSSIFGKITDVLAGHAIFLQIQQKLYAVSKSMHSAGAAQSLFIRIKHAIQFLNV